MSCTLQICSRLPAIVVAMPLLGCTARSVPLVQPAGADRSASTQTLEAGSRLLQSRAPLRPLYRYRVGFQPLQDDPEQQMEAHHYWQQVNEDFAQCVLFDGNTATANLSGIEYIISERLFGALPVAERKKWQPHKGEILSEQRVAPGLPGPTEKALLKTKMHSDGKTWHMWRTGVFGQGCQPRVIEVDFPSGKT